MALPVEYDVVTVRGKYVYLDGTPVAGSVKFTGKVIAVADASDTTIVPTTVSAQLDEAGAFQVDLPATDDPDVTPGGWTYKVTEQFSAGGGRTFELDVPLAAQGTGVDLSDVAPADPSTGDPTAFATISALLSETAARIQGDADTLAAANAYTDANGAGGGSGAVASVNGQTGEVVLDAADVGALADTYTPPAATWADVTGKPSTFPPATHTHVEADVTGLTEELAGKADAASLAAVATSGAYGDLSGGPDLASVATSGSYADLTNTPTEVVISATAPADTSVLWVDTSGI